MKKLSYLLVCLLLINACASKSNDENTQTDSLETEEIITEEIESETTEYDDSFILNLAKNDKDLKDSLNLYLGIIFGEINSEKQIKEAFYIRDKILPKLESAAFDYLAEKQTDYDSELEEALTGIGFQGIYVEGMFMNMEFSSILEAEIEQYASDEFKLKTAFHTAYANSMGTEYPFDSMDDDAEVVRVGEKIMKQFPNSQLYKEIEEEFMTVVSFFTDWHVVDRGDDSETIIVIGGLSTDFYPNGSYESNIVSYTDNFPNSVITPVIEKILQNPSTISTEEDATFHLVVVETLEDYDKAEKAVFNYLLDGIDVPHVLILRDGDTSYWGLVYRFYSQIEKAEEALEIIKPDFPKAKILDIDANGNLY